MLTVRIICICVDLFARPFNTYNFMLFRSHYSFHINVSERKRLTVMSSGQYDEHEPHAQTIYTHYDYTMAWAYARVQNIKHFSARKWATGVCYTMRT